MRAQNEEFKKINEINNTDTDLSARILPAIEETRTIIENEEIKT